MPFAVDPRGFELSEPPEDLELELFEDVADGARSEKRLVEPRLAPKLDAACGATPAAAEPSEEEVLLAVLDDVTVIAEALVEVELDELLDELGVGPLDPPNTLAAADWAPRDDPRLPLTLLRLPRNWGAITAAKRSAAMTPLTRNVRCKSPTPIAAVRTMAPPDPPPPCFGDRRSRFRYKPAPATIATATTPHSNPRGRGLGGTGLTISGRDGARCGRAPPSGLGTEALLISNRMFFVQTRGRSM